jgi:hypothetical protein
MDWTTGVRSPTEAEDFSSSLCIQTSSGAHPASYPMGTGGSFPGGKARPRRDADHSPPSSTEVKNEQELYLLSPQAPSWRVVGQLYFYFTWVREGSNTVTLQPPRKFVLPQGEATSDHYTIFIKINVSCVKKMQSNLWCFVNASNKIIWIICVFNYSSPLLPFISPKNQEFIVLDKYKKKLFVSM